MMYTAAAEAGQRLRFTIYTCSGRVLSKVCTYMCLYTYALTLYINSVIFVL